MSQPTKILLTVLALALAAAAGYQGWKALGERGPGPGFVSGNGRIEATEVDIATLLPGRLEQLAVREGDFVKAGQVLGRMQVQGLAAQRDEAVARQAQARQSVAVARAEVALRESDLDAARRRVARSETLTREGATSAQQLDDDRAKVSGAEAALAASRAQVEGAEAAVRAAGATIARIDSDLADCELRAPRDGRVQYLVAQPGEVLGAGGKVLNLVDITDVHMTFFLPETAAGKVALGGEVRVVLDAAPDFVIPAKVTFVAAVAQFTPKTVETASERQKLMFRVKATIDPALLRRHAEQVKTGLPGVAWLRLDAAAAWPANLTPREAR